MKAHIHFAGTMKADPEIRYTREGVAVTTLVVVWQEGHQVRVRCEGDLAENVALSLTRGMRVVIIGTLEEHVIEDELGDHHSQHSVLATEVAPSLRFVTADLHKVMRPGATS